MVKIKSSEQFFEPVTLIFRFKVKKEKEKEFQKWAHAITQAVTHFEGYLGSDWIHHGSKSREYVVIYKFSNVRLFQKWAHSSVRRKFLKDVTPLIDQQRPQRVIAPTGLETWFTLPDDVVIKPPPRWKMVIATMIGIYPIGLIYQAFLTKYLIELPLLLRPIALSLILTPILTYVIMPNLTKVLHKWLYPEEYS